MRALAGNFDFTFVGGVCSCRLLVEVPYAFGGWKLLWVTPAPLPDDLGTLCVESNSGSSGRLRLLLAPLWKRDYVLGGFFSVTEEFGKPVLIRLAAFWEGTTERKARDPGVLPLVALRVGNLLESRDS